MRLYMYSERKIKPVISKYPVAALLCSRIHSNQSQVMNKHLSLS